MNQFERETLDTHNRYRASHHATPFEWNHNLARDAQAWADYLAHEDRLKHANTDDGENIYMSFGDVKMTGNVAVDKWYQEVKDYSFSRPGFQSNTGHFTQIVWRGSKEIGVGKAQGYDGKIFVVARYRPPGNNLRTFEENVLPAQGHMTNRVSSTGWDHHNLNGNISQFNDSDKYPNSMQNGAFVEQWRSSEKWDPVYNQDKYSAKKGLEENRKKSIYNYQEPSMTVPRQTKPSNPHPKMSNTGETRHNKYVEHKWDSGKWFEEDINEPTITHTQQSSPEKKVFHDTSNLKGVNRDTSPGITARWKPQREEVKAKDIQGKQQWQNERKGFHRDSVGRNKSINKVRLSTEKWESISNEIEIDGREDIKVGRSRTRESIKRWEEKNFNQPNLPFQYPASQKNLIKTSQSKKVYSERWVPLWEDRPLNDSQQRPTSWDSSRCNQNKTDNIKQPKETKITTTIDGGPRKTVVSSVTIVLKGNEIYGSGHKSRQQSKEDFTSHPFTDRDGPRSIKETHIVPEVKNHSYVHDAAESPHGNRLGQQICSFSMLDNFSRQALEYHNNHRALHGAPCLMWSKEIAGVAQAWAEKLAFERTLKHSSRERGTDGENLAMLTADEYGNVAKKAIDMWYEEIRNYDFSRPGYQPRSGHFTQLVWKESKEFGMGRATTSDGELDVVVARYRPPGNVTRKYELNVFPPKSLF